MLIWDIIYVINGQKTGPSEHCLRWLFVIFFLFIFLSPTYSSSFLAVGSELNWDHIRICGAYLVVLWP